MGKERAKGSGVGNRPPAYPQVEFLDELDDAVCRHCKLELGDIIELTIVEINLVKNGNYANWFCSCGNKLKIVRKNGD